MVLHPERLDADTGSAAYEVSGTVMWIRLPRPIAPGDSGSFAFEWSFTPPPSPSDGRQGREEDVYFLGYWYPQLAVYDDVNGWVTDPYINGAEFYMDMADYDVRLTVPRGWVVGATGTLRDSASVLTPRTLERLAAIRGRRDVAHIIAEADLGTGNALVSKGSTATWHFTATNVRDFSWGTGNHYLWDATSALVPDRKRGTTDTIAIHSFFRLSPGGGRLAARRCALHAGRDRTAVPVALAVSLAADDLDGGGADQRRDGIPDDDADAAMGGHAIAGRRPHARDRAHVVSDAGRLERNASCVDGRGAHPVQHCAGHARDVW